MLTCKAVACVLPRMDGTTEISVPSYVLSYRDTWKLFLRFVSDRKRRDVTALSLSDLEATEVLAFLQYLEDQRKVSIGNRNCRLAAIHSFFGFVARREPLAIAQCDGIARIPVKKMNRPAMCYLDAEEITAILRQKTGE